MWDPIPITYNGQRGDGPKSAFLQGDMKLILGPPGCPDSRLAPYTYGRNNRNTTVRNCQRLPDTSVLLYNVTADPTEEHNIAASHPQVVQSIKARMQEFIAQFPNPNYPDNDPNADPSKHNGAWTPWRP
eukprot:m.110593 g.110593  ORF g.110593 m.110593 type:complete len:129 (+) comp14043_c1_seq2:408-794(+)